MSRIQGRPEVYYVFRSHLPLAQCEQRLRDAISYDGLILGEPGYGRLRPIVGRIRGRLFELRRRSYYQGAIWMRTWWRFHGRFNDVPEGTIIHGYFSPWRGYAYLLIAVALVCAGASLVVPDVALRLAVMFLLTRA